MKVLLLNGPPRCGKDTIGLLLSEQIKDVMTFKFADELKDMTHRAFGYSGPADMFESVKDDPDSGPVPGVTWRQAYIAMSEQFVKPLLGVDYFGRVLAQKLTRWEAWGRRLAIVTDSGFREEARALKDAGHDLMRIRICREGCSFDGDSRSYWDGTGVIAEDKEWDLLNGGTLESLSEWAQHDAPDLIDWLEAA